MCGVRRYVVMRTHGAHTWHGEGLKLRESGVAWREIVGETGLVDLDHSRYLGSTRLAR
jgi:hypothetical protein